MKKATAILFFLLVSSSQADEPGYVVRAFTLDGYDDNDIVQMAADILPPAKADAEYRYDRMEVEVVAERKLVRLRPIFKKTSNGFRRLNRETVTFTVGTLEAGVYRIKTADGEIPDLKEFTVEDQLRGVIPLFEDKHLGEIRIARSKSYSPDDYLYPEILDYELFRKNGSYWLSIQWRGNKGLTGDNNIVVVGVDSVVIMPTLRQTDGLNSEKPILVNQLVTLPESVRPGRHPFLVKGKTVQGQTWDLVKVLELE